MVSFKHIALVLSILLSAEAVQAQLPLQDDGQSKEEKRIFPKDMAMFCGISSHSADNSMEVEACLNKILRLSHGKEIYQKEFSSMFQDMYHDYNSDFYDLSVNAKADAGDVDDQINKQVDEKVSAKGAKADNSKNISSAQYKNALLSEMVSKTLLDLVDVTSSLNMLQDMKEINRTETSGKAAEVSED